MPCKSLTLPASPTLVAPLARCNVYIISPPHSGAPVRSFMHACATSSQLAGAAVTAAGASTSRAHQAIHSLAPTSRGNRQGTRPARSLPGGRTGGRDSRGRDVHGWPRAAHERTHATRSPNQPSSIHRIAYIRPDHPWPINQSIRLLQLLLLLPPVVSLSSPPQGALLLLTTSRTAGCPSHAYKSGAEHAPTPSIPYHSPPLPPILSRLPVAHDVAHAAASCTIFVVASVAQTDDDRRDGARRRCGGAGGGGGLRRGAVGVGRRGPRGLRQGPRHVRGQADGPGDVPDVRAGQGDGARADARLLRGAEAGGGGQQDVHVRAGQGPRRAGARVQDQRHPRHGPALALQQPRHLLRLPQYV